jgi:integrase
MNPMLLEKSLEALGHEMGKRTGLWDIPFCADGVERIDKEALRDAWRTLFSLIQGKGLTQQFEMTVSEFVERKFVPEHVALKKVPGQIHYQAILRHVLTPEEVDRAFHVVPKGSRKLLKPIPDWPYLSTVRLCDVHPEHVHRLTSAALARGYSVQTVKHIRNVVSAVFSHAKRELCFMGENPAALIKLPELHRKQAHALSLDQAKEALKAMQYPEKELIMLAAFTGMTPAEICGLQWKWVNLSDVECNADGTSIQPKTIVVARQWHHGLLEDVKDNHQRSLPIPEPLLQILINLKGRARFTGPDDFVLVSRVGTPVNQKDIVARRLGPIAKRMGVPSVSLHTLRHTREILVSAALAGTP